MARRKYQGTARLPGMEETEEREAVEEEGVPAASKTGSRKRRAASGGLRIRLSSRRFILLCSAAVVLLALSLYVLNLMEEFLIRDPRFAIRGPADPGGKPTLEISGARHASIDAIEAVFAEDIGRSVYLIPLEDRLTTLRTVDWVDRATVARIWPNRVLVRVGERTPVAFLTLRGGEAAMIDAGGVILPERAGDFDVPVLAGVDPEAPVEERRDAVARMLRLTGELGDAAAGVSEIDVSDRDNIAISVPYENRILKLMLGDRNFAERYQNFVAHYDDIRSRLPGASVLDLRLEDRITVVQ